MRKFTYSLYSARQSLVNEMIMFCFVLTVGTGTSLQFDHRRVVMFPHVHVVNLLLSVDWSWWLVVG